MCGIDFVTPFQGLNGLRDCSQGVALGCHVVRFQRDDLQPKWLEQGKPGWRPGKIVGKLFQALKGRDHLLRAIGDSGIAGLVSTFIIHRSSFSKC